MGYKTSDVAEKERLEKEGHTVTACIGVPYGSPIYEFDFDVTDKAVEIVSNPPVEQIEEQTKEPIEKKPRKERKKRGKK